MALRRVAVLLVLTGTLMAQTVPVPQTRTLQNGISLGLGIWAEPNPTLQGIAVTTCAGTAGMVACLQAQQAVTNDAQIRGTNFINDILHNYPGAQAGLTNQGLWFKGQ